MSDLKPCPFCGSPAEMEEVNAPGMGDYDWQPEEWVFHVQCQKCYAFAPGASVGDGTPDFAKEMAVKAWNTRTPPEREVSDLSACDKHAQTMPHFTLLAKDNLALGLVQEWVDRAQEEDVPPDKIDAALQTRMKMAEWRKENKHLCKLPD